MTEYSAGDAVARDLLAVGERIPRLPPELAERVFPAGAWERLPPALRRAHEAELQRVADAVAVQIQPAIAGLLTEFSRSRS